MFQSILITAMGAWFLAIAAGLVLIRDAEHRVGEVLHSTRLTAREYAWGSFTGAIAAFFVIWGLFLVLSAVFSDAGDAATRTVVSPGYRDARTSVELGAGESAGFEIEMDFDPEQVLVDPDVLVLQLRRQAAAFAFPG